MRFEPVVVLRLRWELLWLCPVWVGEWVRVVVAQRGSRGHFLHIDRVLRTDWGSCGGGALLVVLHNCCVEHLHLLLGPAAVGSNDRLMVDRAHTAIVRGF